ncbi:LysR family transcriptional regulator [Halobacillus salinarum]|uniref:LysR family transcriptional regulator n=1 Tax=Halobacillus salinarum TaxID=2932257 RepID=A0ABY4EK83_9BACI|nr:LysR family transcriptional regulator [Halobacillus salinarum]UOQ44457.1 LysR family transcriptional regulator [Halobacillus salinarum]
MKIEDYQLLIHLSENKTIRATAKKILISQPALTQRLKYIEEYFDTPIFVRTPKRLEATPSGELILAHAKKMMLEEKRVHELVSKTRGTISGTLSLGVSSLVSQHFLPEILESFTTDYPEVHVDLITGVSEEIRRSSKEYHVCIIRGGKMKELSCTLLFEDPLYLFDTVPLDGNVVRPFIEFKSEPEYQMLVEEWLSQNKQLQVKRSIKVDQFETAKQMMIKGLGMTVLPKSIVTEEMRGLPHVPLLHAGKTISRDTWVCSQNSMKELPQVAAFLSFLEGKIGNRYEDSQDFF